MTESKFTAQQIANWYLKKGSLSPKKLQKILYYAYSWVLTLTNDDVDHLDNKLFDDTFEAWAHGPVLNDIYSKYKSYGYNDIPEYNGEVVELPDDVEDILNQVWDEYGAFTADQLENLSHREAPWIKARGDATPLSASTSAIYNKDIFKCYIERVTSTTID